MKGLVWIMKFKYYIRGFGTGVLFATVILMITLGIKNNIPSGKGKNKNDSDNPVIENISQDSVKDESGNTTNGAETTAPEDTTVPEDTSAPENTTVPENTSDLTSVPEETTAPEDTSAPENTTVPENTSDLTSVPEETTAPEAVTPPEETVFTLSITSGMTSNRVADILVEQGLVDNGYNFNMYLHENGYASKLRVGDYQIKSGLSYGEIADIITKK